MKTFLKPWAITAMALAAFLSLLAPHVKAQGNGAISGTILDINGKPWYNLNVEAVSEQGAKLDTKTDQEGKYAFRNLRTGIYVVTITAFPPPNEKQGAVEVGKLRVGSSDEVKADMNFKDVLAKQGAAAQEQVKKQSEEKARFEGMKTHFNAGAALLEQERKAKDDLSKAAPDQRDQLKQSLKDLSDKAAAEFQEAQKSAPEKDANQALIWGNLGQAYDIAGRNEEAAQAYQQATLAKPDEPGYYNNLGNVLARAGKIDEARAAYSKSAELDPTKAAMAWRNFGISLYNAGRLKEAVEPLKKATDLDPKSAQAWYLLGAALVGSMETKKNGDKLEFIVQPGTVEAYQKAVDLDPNGTYGSQAKQGLEALQQIAPGIDTKVNVKKKKS